jgi:diadenylate cyclase
VIDLAWYLQQLDWLDALDILLVGATFFGILYILRGTRAVPLLRGVVFLVIAVSLLSGIVRLRAFAWLTQQALPALLVAVPVVFQQELRRALEQLGRAGALWERSARRNAPLEQTLATVAAACKTLAESRHGALVVLERDTGLQEIADTGVLLDAMVTQELLITVFDPHTLLHDGGAILRDGRVLAAACVLPLSTAFLADRQLGLRHRAALGVTEESDAVVIVVSEERGSISIAQSGRIIRNLDAKRLEPVLRVFFQPAIERAWPRWAASLRRILGSRED